MANILQFRKYDKESKAYKDVGKLEVVNMTDAEAAEIYIYGDICNDAWDKYTEDDTTPADIAQTLKGLEDVKKLTVHINSGGGSVFGGLAIYNMLKSFNAEITVKVEGLAASIASVIAMAGDKIIIPANAMLMIHKPAGLAMGTADELRKMADTLDSCQDLIINTYMDKCKKEVTRDTITELVNAETWLNGLQAAEYFNLEVTETVQAAACASDYFNQYKNVPQQLTEKPEDKADNMAALADQIAAKVTAALKAEPEAITDDEPEDSQETKKEMLLKDLDLI